MFKLISDFALPNYNRRVLVIEGTKYMWFLMNLNLLIRVMLKKFLYMLS
jgi:hypothetical protein